MTFGSSAGNEPLGTHRNSRGQISGRVRPDLTSRDDKETP